MATRSVQTNKWTNTVDRQPENIMPCREWRCQNNQSPLWHRCSDAVSILIP